MNEPGFAPSLLLLTVAAAVVFGSIHQWILVSRRWIRGRRLLRWRAWVDRPWGLIDLMLVVSVLMISQALIATFVLNRQGQTPATRSLPVAGVLASGLASGAGPAAVSATGGVTFAVTRMSPQAQATLLAGSSASMLLTLAASMLWLRFRYGAAVNRFGMDLRKLRYDIRLGFRCFLLLTPIVYAIQWLLVQWFESRHPLIELLQESPDPLFFMLSGFSAVLVAPLAEEVFFRLYLQGWLDRVFVSKLSGSEVLVGGPLQQGAPVPRSLWPVLCSAVLFALAHYSHGPDPVPLFVLAVGLGILYQRTQRITACIVVHLLLNASSLIILFFVVYFGAG